VVGRVLAKRLGVDDSVGANHVLVDGTAMSVVGVVEDGEHNAVLSNAVVMAPETAAFVGIQPTSRLVMVRVKPGRAGGVARAFPQFVDPVEAGSIAMGVAPSPAALRQHLLASTRSTVIVIALVMSLALIFGIMTTMQIAVWERRSEVGVARALGASRSEIAIGFLVESMLLGFGGALAGTLLGVVVSAGISRVGQWSLDLPPWVLLIPLAGAAAGALAGALPAWRATATDPAELLRST